MKSAARTAKAAPTIGRPDKPGHAEQSMRQDWRCMGCLLVAQITAKRRKYSRILPSAAYLSSPWASKSACGFGPDLPHADRPCRCWGSPHSMCCCCMSDEAMLTCQATAKSEKHSCGLPAQLSVHTFCTNASTAALGASAVEHAKPHGEVIEEADWWRRWPGLPGWQGWPAASFTWLA